MAQQGGDAGESRAPEVEDPRAASPAPGVMPEVAVGAPPEELGRTDRAARDEPELDYWEEEERELDEVDPELEHEAIEAGALQDPDDRDYEPVEDVLGDEEESGETYAPRGRRGSAEGAGHGKSRSRVVQFLVAVWAELQRVQWPNRQALTTLTGVVLGFVLIAGGYLGLLDAVFSRIIQAIL
jgi:preprotein translocase SecE subunit